MYDSCVPQQRSVVECVESLAVFVYLFVTELLEHIREVFTTSISPKDFNPTFQLSLYFCYEAFEHIECLVAMK